MIQHIFFDLDNTLWDHRRNAYLTLQNLFAKKNIEKTYQIDFEEFHDRYHIINENLWALLRDEKIDKAYLRKHRFYDTFLHFGVDNFELSQLFEDNFLDEILAYNELIPGTIEILEYLASKDYQMHIISNGFEEVTHRKVELSGLSKYFVTITSADSTGYRKPHPQIFEHCLKIAQATKENSILIGDDYIADVLGAQNFGIEVIFFDALNENLSLDQLKVIKNLSEIKSYL